jgi:transposase
VRRRRRARLAAAGLGRSRGGLTTKTHLSCVPQCLPLSLKITAGQAGDSPQFIPVLNRIRVPGPVGRPRTRPDAVAGDKAYSSRQNRSHLRTRGIKAVIPEKKDQAAHRKNRGSRGGRPVTWDKQLYKLRNSVERTINKIKDWRGLAVRYDKSLKATRPDSSYAPASSGSSTSDHSLDHNSIQTLVVLGHVSLVLRVLLGLSAVEGV